jgi:hypothetical protein
LIKINNGRLNIIIRLGDDVVSTIGISLFIQVNLGIASHTGIFGRRFLRGEKVLGTHICLIYELFHLVFGVVCRNHGSGRNHGQRPFIRDLWWFDISWLFNIGYNWGLEGA